MPKIKKGIEKEKKWTRKCPTCPKILYYNTTSLYNRAEKNGKGCRACGQKFTKIKNGFKSSWCKGLTKDDPRVAYMCRNAFGTWSKDMKGKTYEEIYGVERAKEIKIKKAEIFRHTNFVQYNIKSIEIIEAKAKEYDITDLQHAENGGEVPIFTNEGNLYYVDGFSKEKNIVIEYYETRHKKQVEYDERRKQEIVDYLGCDFIEIKEWE